MRLSNSAVAYRYAADGTKLRETRTVSGTAIVVDDAGTVLETDDYYPLGGPLPTGTSTALQPQKYQAHSPYLFCAGNPMRFVDPEGKEIRIMDQDDSGENKELLYHVGMKKVVFQFVCLERGL